MESITCAESQPSTLRGMDLLAIRRRLIAERERMRLTQEEFGAKAGFKQGVISKWEDLSEPLTEMLERVLFQIIERALEISVTKFFAEIEGKATGMEVASLPSPRPSEG